MPNKRRKMVRKRYGARRPDKGYDPFIGQLGYGLFKSSAGKEKDELDIKLRGAKLHLTNAQSVAEEAKAQAETYKAQAERHKSIAAEAEAEQANVNLQGAKSMRNLSYLGYIMGGMVVIAAGALAFYLYRQSKIASDKAKQQAAEQLAASLGAAAKS